MFRLTGIVGVVALTAISTLAGEAVAQEVVQPLPPPGTDALNAALRRLAANPRDLSALLNAGDAALQVGDTNAALGFFSRARDISPNDARGKLGMATVFARTRRPVEALRLFAEAEAAGADRVAMAVDRGLSFDLVGDSASAQENYRLALSRTSDPEVVRRLALSQAISGDQAGFDATLLPLLERRDLAAYRTRAFGLAILGKTDEAVSIAEQMMPRAMSSRMGPYLRTMPRLTPAQQAAAGNLGVFPRAGSIAPTATRVATTAAATRIPPVTAEQRPSTPPPQQQAQVAPPQRERRPVSPSQTADIAREGRVAALAAASRAPTPGSAAVAATSRPSSPSPALVAAPSPIPMLIAPTSEPATPSNDSTVVAQPASVSGELPPVGTPVQSTETATFAAGAPAAIQPSAVQSPVAPAPSSAAPIPALVAQTEPAVAATPPAPVSPVADEVSLEDAFASFVLPSRSAAEPEAGAVDITAITIPRELPKPKPEPEPKADAAKPAKPAKAAKPEKPAYPARHWVQVATGKNLKALLFDWNKIVKKANGKLDKKGPFTAPWVEANRLLAGPYDSPAAAREMVKQLKAMGIDSFTYSSPAGEEIKALD